MKLKKFKYPDYVNFNNKIGSLLIEWSKTKKDFRVGGPKRHRFFDPECTWHSVDNLFDFKEFLPLCDFILDNVPDGLEFETMWAILAKTGSKGLRHSHKGNLSYCYYISNGHNDDEEVTGKVSIETSNGDEVVEPQDGLLLTFSARAYHTIHEYLGDKTRIVIAGNLKMK
jgi:hypothetical protein